MKTLNYYPQAQVGTRCVGVLPATQIRVGMRVRLLEGMDFEEFDVINILEMCNGYLNIEGAEFQMRVTPHCLIAVMDQVAGMHELTTFYNDRNSKRVFKASCLCGWSWHESDPLVLQSTADIHLAVH